MMDARRHALRATLILALGCGIALQALPASAQTAAPAVIDPEVPNAASSVTLSGDDADDAMPDRPQHLINGTTLELWPGWLLRARSNADARRMARARWVLRAKRDGRFLAAVDAAGRLLPLGHGVPAAQLEEATALLLDAQRIPQPQPPASTPGVEDRLQALGVDGDAYAAATGLPAVDEPRRLRFAGRDRYRRPLWLKDGAAQAWLAMQAAAKRDGVVLEAISGYRSHAYQQSIFERKQSRGQAVDAILKVNAAPGFSEHHGGCALDIGTPGDPPAEESFEKTGAFAWLLLHAGGFGFTLSYPRDNPYGIVYEPWHWCWRPQPLAHG